MFNSTKLTEKRLKSKKKIWNVFILFIKQLYLNIISIWAVSNTNYYAPFQMLNFWTVNAMVNHYTALTCLTAIIFFSAIQKKKNSGQKNKGETVTVDTRGRLPCHYCEFKINFHLI